MKKIIVIAALLFLTGCAVQKPWVKAEKLYANQRQGFTVELPDNWMRSGKDDFLVATRDGFPLQSIYIRRFDIKENLLKNTKKTLQRDMLPHEVAETILDDTILDSSLTDVKTEENIPITIGGILGFRLVYTFKNKSGLKMKAVLCGCLRDDSLLLARYSAPQRHYFDMDIATFEKAFQSLKITDEKKQ